MNIRVISADLPWIAGRLARELVKHLPKYGITAEINGRRGDLEYQQIVYGPPETHPAVGLFTHGRVRPANFGKDYEGHIALNPDMAGFLAMCGARNPIVIEQAVDEPFIRRDIKFGVAGRAYADHRKGEDLVAEMVKAGYNVRAWGNGWPCEIVSDRYEDLPNFYRSLDYYVVTSREEGGCSPIIECMAMGVPVITPRIGFAIVRPVLEYKVGDWESLNEVLRFLTVPRTYEDWARDHANYFRAVIG